MAILSGTGGTSVPSFFIVHINFKNDPEFKRTDYINVNKGLKFNVLKLARSGGDKMIETKKHMQAFEIYYKTRVLADVAKEMNISAPTVSKWCREFKWEERAKYRDIENGKRVIKQSNKKIINSLVECRQITLASIQDYADNLADGKVKITSPSDFIKLVELEIKLAELTNTNNSSNTESKKTSESISKLMSDFTDVLNNLNGGVK